MMLKNKKKWKQKAFNQEKKMKKDKKYEKPEFKSKISDHKF